MAIISLNRKSSAETSHGARGIVELGVMETPAAMSNNRERQRRNQQRPAEAYLPVADQGARAAPTSNHANIRADLV